MADGADGTGRGRLPALSPHLRAVRALRALGAGLVVAAVLRQLVVAFEQPQLGPVDLFSFFTIQSNIIAAAIWAWGAWRPESTAARPLLRGAATTYLAITGLIYLALSWDPNKDEALALTAPWVNVLTHGVLPTAAFVEWVLLPPGRRITARHVGRLLLYPVAFFLLSLLRGAFSGRYPYPFLQPGYWGGYDGVLLNALIVLAMMLPIMFGVAWVGTRRSRGASAPPGDAERPV